MKRFAKRLVILVAMLVGTGATSCAAGSVEKKAGLETALAALPEMVDVTDLVYVQIDNSRNEGFTMYAVWNGGRQELGYIDALSQTVFPFDVPDGTLVRAEMHFDSGFRCITFAVPAPAGGTLTLRMHDGPIAASFCEPIRSATIERLA